MEHRFIEVKDPNIEASLAKRQSDDELIKIAIYSAKKTKAEYESEQKKVTKAAAKFSYILQNDAMIPYCDTIGNFYKEQIENAKLRERMAEKESKKNPSEYNERKFVEYTNKRKQLEVCVCCPLRLLLFAFIVFY